MFNNIASVLLLALLPVLFDVGASARSTNEKDLLQVSSEMTVTVACAQKAKPSYPVVSKQIHTLVIPFDNISSEYQEHKVLSHIPNAAKLETRHAIHQWPRLHEREIAERLLHRLLLVASEVYKDLGASEEVLEKAKQKRNMITTCYFHAVSCY